MRKRNKEMTYRGRELRGMWFRILLGILFITPVLLALLLSFVPDSLLSTGLPSIGQMIDNFTLDNYQWLFQNIPVLNYVKNTLLMCFIVVVAHAVFGTFGAYAFAFFDFKGKKFLFQLMVLAMAIPGEVCIICNFLTIKSWGLLSTMIGLTITSWSSCHTVFMLRQCYLSMPKEIKESAMLDGCGEMGYLFRFAIPLSMPTLASLSITSFIGIFNAYLWPLIVARDPSMYTINIGMGVLFAAEVPTYGKFMAGAAVSMLLPILVFIVFQKQIVKGMTKGAVKG